MKIVSTSYVNTPSCNDPRSWLDRIGFHTGILEHLAKHHTVESIEQINYSGKLEHNGVMHHFLNYKEPISWFPRRLHRYIKNLKPDLVFIHGLIFPLQVIQLRRLLGKKPLIIVQHHAEKPFPGFKKMLQTKADRHINAYFFTSEEMGMEWVRAGIIKNKKKIFGVMEGSSTFHVTDKNSSLLNTEAHGHPIFLWVGRLDANKDPITVVKAFLQFIKHQPAARLYMIYQSEEKLQEIKTILDTYDTMKSISLVGMVPHHQLGAWYNSADFILSGSHYEGSGIAVCEAMSCGAIPVITNIMSFRSMTGHGKCGILYEPGNENDLLSALMRIKELDIERERGKILQQFHEMLSFEAIAKKINEVISSLLSKDTLYEN